MQQAAHRGTARERAIARQEDQIAANVAKIEEAKQRPTALMTMGDRLGVSAPTLQKTLLNTVFKGASEAEFIALVIVANAYNLNPLLKEIYAFQAKGGGIIPYVSVDGWVRIINEHPQFDGLEFNDIVDEKGELYAIESVIYRRDRSRPIKVTEYLDECRGTGPAWQKTPKRMLRHRALMQGGRYAFGFSGIYGDGDVELAIDGGEWANATRTLPQREELITHDRTTGEILDERPIDEETQRALDAEGLAEMDRRTGNDGTLSEENPTAAEGPSDEQRGDGFDGSEQQQAEPAGESLAESVAREMIARCVNAKILGDALNVESDLRKHRPGLGEQLAGEVDKAIAAARARFGKSAK